MDHRPPELALHRDIWEIVNEQFTDADAARLLRPKGRLVFLPRSVTIALCVPDEGGVAGPTPVVCRIC